MKHVSLLRASMQRLPDSFVIRATGRYYTPNSVARLLVGSMLSGWKRGDAKTLRVIDPFAGDGRLAFEVVRQGVARGLDANWDVHLWDLEQEGLRTSRATWRRLVSATGARLTLKTAHGDAFEWMAQKARKGHEFDFVVSNPPMELLKPDRRELACLSSARRAEYIATMREYDAFLAREFPEAQPSRKFAGWGTNLSRVGFAVCQRLVREGGVLGVVMPVSFVADEHSARLREEAVRELSLQEVRYFPAEAKLFGKADIESCTVVATAKATHAVSVRVTRHDAGLEEISSGQFQATLPEFRAQGWSLPVTIDPKLWPLLARLRADFPPFAELEDDASEGLWAGREVDETAIAKRLTAEGTGLLFVKGRMIRRFGFAELPTEHFVGEGGVPASAQKRRIVWRDVSRPNQKRRLIASTIAPGYVAGNSLGVAYFRDDNDARLLALLGVMSSLVFEFQLRAHLATGHVSLSSLRKVRLPGRVPLGELPRISAEVARLSRGEVSGEGAAEARLEALVAREVYGLNAGEFEAVLGQFPKLTSEERAQLRVAFEAVGGGAPGVVPSESI